MATTEVTISFHVLSRELQIPEERVQAVVELLDAGNTVPFITRYRKDQTGGLDEEKIRAIQDRVTKLRQLAERKQTVLRAIEAQNKLTPVLAKKILAATTLKRLEDLYLPFKPKKQTLATIAREKGLGHLAEEILNADPICADLDKRAADYVDRDKKILSGADALLGAGHILAETFSENAALRARLRDILKKTGVIRTVRIVPEQPPAVAAAASATGTPGVAGQAAPAATANPPQNESVQGEPPTSPLAGLIDPPVAEAGASAPPSQPGAPGDEAQQAVSADSLEQSSPSTDETSKPGGSEPNGSPEQSGSEANGALEQSGEEPTAQDRNSHQDASDSSNDVVLVADATSAQQATTERTQVGVADERSQATQVGEAKEDSGAGSPMPSHSQGESVTGGSTGDYTAGSAAGSTTSSAAGQLQAGGSSGMSSSSPSRAAPPIDPRKAAKDAEKRRKEEQRIKEFANYFAYQEPIRKIPPHRILAVNRGEALKIIRVKIEVDQEAMDKALDEICVPKDHPHADFLRGCARDALQRLVLPSLEREIRRELTEKAEAHAVRVFAKNLRRLLLQRPVPDRRVLAIDPGFRNGCKLAALDEYGNVLDHGLIYIVERRGYTREMAKKTICEMVEKHQLTAVAIGNGTGCRLAETFIAELLENELKGKGIGYTIVNEAGASVYSTSQIGREELPQLEASYRGAVSIGRRLLDPLSELVKIDPPNLGVGMYQHDIKEKHLRDSLDEVVESCVNYVGVDVNTASPALLGYVSGLNKLTARRIYEYRQQNGAFRSREELKKVPGIGEATFVQAAGFLKIAAGDNPLDSTWIHPESYDLVRRVMEKLEITPETLRKPESRPEIAAKINQVDAETLAAELGCGVFTLRDILNQLVRPGRDPREDLPPPVFKQGILKLEDLSPGMELIGTVLNVVDFGAFVDIGLPNSGLVHRSRMDRKGLVDPHSVVAVGDVIRVWVVEVDRDRRRISLSMVPLDQLPRFGGGGDGQFARGPRERPPRQRKEGPKREPSQAASDGEKQGEKPRFARRSREERRPPLDNTRTSRDGTPATSRPVSLPRRPSRHEPPPPPEPLSEDVLAGKQPMRSFGDLMQYFAAKGVVRPAPAKPQRGNGGKKRRDNDRRNRPDDGQSRGRGEKRPATAPPDSAASAGAEPPVQAVPPTPPAAKAPEPSVEPAAANVSPAESQPDNGTPPEIAPQASSAVSEPAAEQAAPQQSPPSHTLDSSDNAG